MLELLEASLRSFAVDQAGHLLLADHPDTRVRTLRQRFGMTQKELAACVDLRRESLSRIESGRQSPSADLLRTLVRVFTLAHAAREHVARAETGDPVDRPSLTRVATQLKVPPEVADDVITHAVTDYGGKRRAILESLREDDG